MRSKRDTESLRLKKVLKKFNKVRIINSDDFNGKVRILNIRFYNINHDMQVDIEFDGGFSANSRGSKVWVSNSNVENFSKVMVNRFVRRKVGPYLKTHLLYFGIDLPSQYCISKIVWVKKS